MALADTGRWSDQARIAFLLEGAQQFGGTLDEQRIYRSLRQILSDALPMDGLIVSSFDPTQQLVFCEYIWSDGNDLNPADFPPIQWDPTGKGMQGRVILTGKSEIFDVKRQVTTPGTSYVEVSPDGGPAPVNEEPATRSAMMTPMILEAKVTGVVQVMSDRPNAYGPDDLVALEGLVLQMTAAWHHARLFQKAEQDRRMIDRIVSASPDVIYIFDLTSGSSSFSNGKLARMLGYEEAEFVALGLQNLLHPDDYAIMPDLWGRFLEIADGEIRETEYRIRSKQGEWRWFLNRDTPFERDAEGNVTRILGVGRDITARKEQEFELENRVAQRTSELEAAVRELEGFTYSVSHDLRGPLRAISAASMIVREDYGDRLPEEAKRQLLRQAESAKKMGTLIDDLLKLSRLGRQELKPEPFDLSALAAEVIFELRVEDRTEVEPNLQTFGDPRLVRFVILNLIENAVKFSPDGGKVRLFRAGEAFAVSDEGIGFEIEYEPKIFLPFERLVRENDYPGTGIGLANAHRIVQRHGGRIWAKSEMGKGSTFYFTLPAEPRAAS